MAGDEKLEPGTFGSRLRFDMFELDCRAGEVWRCGVPVDLPPQALKILTLLAARPNRLVTRKEIKETLWPGESHGDFDSRTNFAVRKLREALNDDAERPRYIRTIRNAGYMFIASVQVQRMPSWPRSSEPPDSAGLENTQSNNDLPHAASLGRTKEFWEHRLFLGVVAVILVAGTVGGLVLRQRDLIRATAPESFSDRGPRPELFETKYDARYEPYIMSVTPIAPEARQTVIIRGRGFGVHVPYAQTDSPYLSVRNVSAHWAAGRMIPLNWDEVMVDVTSWSDSEIVLSGFSGSYGRGGWKLTSGDKLEIAVWNPQSGAGPALFDGSVVSGK